jgi:pimeloyl-ACP methyl ester carboxylesterase
MIFSENRFPLFRIMLLCASSRMHHMLTAVVEILAAGAVITLIGKALIERAHPPRGRFVDVGGLRQHVVEIGAQTGTQDASIVLIHGAGCNLEDMRLALGERLAARHRVILIDRSGLGWSERGGGRGSSPAYQAAILRGVLDRLGVGRAIVVGHSWGGALAAAFALDHPQRVAGLVLLAPPLYPFPRRATWLYEIFALPVFGWFYAHTLALPLGAPFIGMAMASAFLPQWPPHGYIKRTGTLLLLRPATFLANARDVADLRSALATQSARYGAITAPTLIITGDRDLVVPAKQHAIAGAAAVPNAKLVVLPGLGHMLHHAAADRVIAEIEALATRATGE